MHRDEVVIVGGGFAGLAAGVALAACGQRVRLLEQNPHLGGRARSFLDRRSGARLDNGQHIFMGCYHAALRFLSTIGGSERIHFQSRLAVRFAERGGKLSGLRCPRAPAPWHVLLGVLASDSLNLREKAQILRMGCALSKVGSVWRGKASSGLTVREWLSRHGQSSAVQSAFWDLLAIAAMNDRPEVAAASVFEAVVQQALFRSASDSRIGFAQPGLTECYTDAATDFITRRGGSVERGRRVLQFMIASGGEGPAHPSPANCSAGTGPSAFRWRIQGVSLADGERIESSRVVSAVPWFRLGAILPPDLLHEEQIFQNCLRLEPVPIVSMYCWFDRPVTNEDFIGLRGTTIQWLFNKGAPDGRGPFLVSLVISGARKEVEFSRTKLVETALTELRELFPAAREARLLRALVIKERFATFSPRVQAEAFRPAAVTPVRGLYLAGDWTATGLPATIEGAVRSGYTAADAISQVAMSEK
jgi:squalene-associated FAD-dependent desaturase